MNFCNKKAIIYQIYTLYIQGESMSDGLNLFKTIINDNKKLILDEAAEEYQSEIKRVVEIGENAWEAVHDFLSSKKPSQENQEQLALPERNQGLPLTYTESAFPEKQSAGTLEMVTRKEMPEATANSGIFRNISYGVSGFSARAVYKDKVQNQSYSLYLGEKAGIGYEKREGCHNDFVYGAKADYNLFSGRASLCGYYRTPNEAVGGSIFYKHGNYGVSTEYSNHSGFEAKFAIDKTGASLNAAYNHQFDDFRLNVGAFGSTEQKVAGVTARLTF